MASIRKKKQAAKRNNPRRSLMEHIRSLPPELEQQVDQSVNDLMQSAQGESEASAVSSASVKPIPVNVSVKVEQEQVKQEEKKQQDELKVDKNLLKAVEKLTKSFDFANKKAEEEKKKGLRGFINNKIQNVKNAFTLEGAAGMLGVRKDDGSLKGAILGSIMERREKKQEKAQFIANFGQFTETGRGLKGEELAAEGGRRYEALKKIQSEREFLGQKAAQAKAFGGDLTEDQKRRMSDLEKSEEVVRGTSKETQAAIPSQKQQTAKQTVAEQTIEQSTAPIMSVDGATTNVVNSNTENSTNQTKVENTASGNGIMDLVHISEQQLKVLEEIAKASKPSEEDLLEDKRQESLAPIMERKEQAKDANSNGSLLDLVKSMLPNIPKIPNLMNIGRGAVNVVRGGIKAVSSVGKFAVRGLGKVGSLVGSGISRVAGAGAKVLPSILSGAQKGMGVASKFAGAVPGVAKAAGGLAKGVLGKLGPIAMLGMAAYDGISGYGKAAENLDIDGREATTGEKLASAGGSILSGLSFGLLDEKSMSKGIANLVGAGPEKLPDVARVQQAQELAVKKIQGDMEAAAKNVAPVVTNAPTTIINNNGGSDRQRFSIRNTDNSYNDRLSRHFAFQ
jgi:hypothetical protein